LNKKAGCPILSFNHPEYRDAHKSYRPFYERILIALWGGTSASV